MKLVPSQLSCAQALTPKLCCAGGIHPRQAGETRTADPVADPVPTSFLLYKYCRTVPLVMSSQCVLNSCYQDYTFAEMRAQNVLAATLVGLPNLVTAAPAASASCVTTTYASAVPGATATAVALRALAYCGGTLYADAYVEVRCFETTQP